MRLFPLELHYVKLVGQLGIAAKGKTTTSFLQRFKFEFGIYGSEKG